MKARYIVFLGIIIVALIILEAIMIFSPLGEYPRLENIIQTSAVFVALIAAIIALSTADPRQKPVSVNINLFKQNRLKNYSKETLPQHFLRLYADFPDPFHSQRIHFVMKNTSGFTLIKPTLTFRLPNNRQQPEKTPEEWTTTFNSNLFNSRADMRQLEFNDTVIISNSNLPYWNNLDSITIWIRMITDSIATHPFLVVVSINSQNAQGITKTIKIDGNIPILGE